MTKSMFTHIKESNAMRKTIFIVGLAIVMTFAFSAVAFAHHAPSFYIDWNGAAPGNTNGPHTDYQKTSSKCAVCHAVHRAPVEGNFWTGATVGREFRSAWTATANTEMLLRSSVANACSYCHLETATGGIRLYNGNALNFNDNNGNFSWPATGFAHNTGCTNCHAVHGAKTFKGAIAEKILRYNYSSSGVVSGAFSQAGIANALDANHVYTDPITSIATTVAIQDEIFRVGGGANAGQVDTGSVPVFNNLAGAIEGTNTNGADPAWGANVKQAQGTAFCTICHANYSSGSEVVINLDGEMALFQAGWYVQPNGPSGVGGTTGGSFRYKNHPVGPATANFQATGSTIGSNQTVAFAGADFCRSCHDAGEVDASTLQPSGYVVENSYPHFTPGYYKFMSSAATQAASYASNDDAYADGLYIGATPVALGGVAAVAGTNTAKAYEYEDGHCLKCHVNSAGTRGVNLSF